MIIVEPHADDAFLSMGGIIERETKAGNPVTIVTVYSATRKRAEDAKAYANAVGARWFGLGFTEMGNAKENGPALISDLLDFEVVSFDQQQFVLPLAISHPEHIEVRTAFEKALAKASFNYPVTPFWYYLDQPYASKLKNQEAVREATRGKAVVDIFRPGAVKYRHAKLFKDQQKFFHFNPPTDLEMKGFELVVR